MKSLRNKVRRLWLTILIASFSVSNVAYPNEPLTPDIALTVLAEDPVEDNIVRYFVPTVHGNGWIIHNMYRERLINAKLKDCTHVTCPNLGTISMPKILTETPPIDKIKRQYFPVTGTDGWWVHNTFRENLINFKLKECEKLKDGYIPMCEEMATSEPAFWQEPYFFGTAVVSSFVLGILATMAMTK